MKIQELMNENSRDEFAQYRDEVEELLGYDFGSHSVFNADRTQDTRPHVV